jgi:hypothetical protein
MRSDVAGRIARVDAIARVESARRARARGEDARRRSSIGAIGAVGAVGRRARAARMMMRDDARVGTRARESATLERARDDDRGDDDDDDDASDDASDARDAREDESTRRCGNGSSSSESSSESRRTARRDGALGVDRGRAVAVDVRG